ncbi:MAG: hypothetical protein U0X87_14710 [Anaerolineales bacterium]
MKSRWIYLFSSIEGAVAMVALLLIPSEGASLSPARLALIAIIFSLILMSAWLAFRPPQPDRLARTPLILLGTSLSDVQPAPVSSALSQPRLSSPALHATQSVAVVSAHPLDSTHALPPLPQKRISPRRPQTKQTDLSRTRLPHLLCCSFAHFYLLTKLGITKDTAYWGERRPDSWLAIRHLTPPRRLEH